MAFFLFQVNKQGRSGSSAQKERSIWEESRAQELIQRVLNKELSLTAASIRLGVDTNTFFAHLTDNGKNKSRMALLLGTDANSSDGPYVSMNASSNHNEDSNSANASATDPVGEDSNTPDNGGGQGSDDSNMESIVENSQIESEVNGERDDNEEPEIVDGNNGQTRSSEQQILGLQEMNTDETVEEQMTEDQQDTTQQSMETFQSIVEEDSNNLYADASQIHTMGCFTFRLKVTWHKYPDSFS